MPLSITKTFFLAITSISLALALILFPKESLDASIRGMQMWWDVVFPSLLPFFIVSELLIGFGVVTFIGTLLEPFMRPLFRVPGVGGFVWAMGLASGNPAGAKITARLRNEKKITRIEAERLVCFTNSANPLFIFGAIAVGFFQDAFLGFLLAAAHYLGNVFVGFIMRYYGRDEERSSHRYERSGLITALKLMHQDRLKDGRPIGKLLGDAVHSSVRTLLMIGGFIILFSVLNKILSIVGVTKLLASLFSIAFIAFHIPTELSIPFISGLFEITLGAKLISQTDVELLEKVVIASFIIAFGGFSIQSQVASILAETDIRFKPFFVARIIHGFLSAIIAYLLWHPIYLKPKLEEAHAVPVFLKDSSSQWFETCWHLIEQFGASFTLVMLILFIVLSVQQTLKKDS